MTGPQYPQPQPYGQGPQQPYGQQPPMRPTAPRQPMAEPVRNALIVAGVVVVVSVLIMVTSWLLVGLAILLVGGFYAFLVFRGMPPFANVNQTMDALKSLSGPSRAPTGYAPGHQQPVQHQQPGQQQQYGYPSSPNIPSSPGMPSSPNIHSAPNVPSTPAMPAQGGFTEAMAADPSTPAEVLNRIAADAPHLRPALARNPATYDDLLTWLGSLGDPAVNAELARRPR